MSWIDEIKDATPVNKFSQSFEEGIILYILDNIGHGTKYLVDIGAGCYGGMMSNTKLLLNEYGWGGLRFDMNTKDDPGIIEAFIMPSNIVKLLKENNCPKEFDFLNVDLDSFDYDITENVLKEFSPRFMCLEFNPSLPVNSAVKLEYHVGYTWDSTNKYGFSFGAAKVLCRKYGYEIVYNHIGLNLFLVRKDQIEGIEFEEVTAVQKFDHPVNDKAVWVNVE